ncbi:MAG: hypothetical protein V4773_14825, partial [Verrucomicrobiota bacterium]
MKTRFLCLVAALALPFVSVARAKTADERSKLVIVAGKPSHPAGMHEFNAGSQLLAKALAQGA